MAALIFQLTSDALSPLQLDTEPIGWDGMRYLFARDLRLHGVALSVSVDLTFVKQAAEYLRIVYEGGTDAQGRTVAARGVEALVTLTVFEQNPNEFRPEEIYRGQLDFTTYSSSETGVTAKFRETGFATTLLTRDQAAVDLLGGESLSGVALPSYVPVTVGLHSQQTLQRFELRRTTPDTTPLAATITAVNDPAAESSVLLFFGMDAEPVLNEFGISSFPIGPELGDSFSAVNVPFYTAKVTGTHTLDFDLRTQVAVTQRSGGGTFGAVDIKYELRTVIGGVTVTTALGSRSATAPFPPFPGDPPVLGKAKFQLNTGPRSFTFDLNPGDTVAVYGEVFVHEWNPTNTHAADVRCAMGVGSYLKLSAPTTTKETTCAGLLMHEALARCVEACTDQRDSFYSDYFGRTDCRVPYATDGPGAYRLLTDGFQLRGFPLRSAPAPVTGEPDPRKTITAALRDLYESVDATDCLGMGIEQRGGRPVVRVEPRAHFYQAAEVLHLGRVAELKKTVLPDLLYNEVQVGYAHWQSGAPNGLDEFNALRTYALPLTQLKQQYMAVSKVNAAGYLIEEARRDRYNVGATKEGKADAELFVICLHKDLTSYTSARAEGFVPGSITGIISPNTAYNLPLSPGRMLARHGFWLRAGLAAQLDKRLLPGKAEGNAHLRSQRVGDAAPLDEFLAVPVADLAPPVVLAETYEFTVRLRRGQFAALSKNPYGRISFLDSQGRRKAGYLLRAERTPQGGRTTFTLLRAAS